MSDKEVKILASVMDFTLKSFTKGEQIISEGEQNDEVFVVLSGGATGERNMSDGRTFIVNELTAGGVFGDVLSGSSALSPVDIVATEACTTLSFKLSNILTACERCGEAKQKLLRNFILAISDKYFALNRRVRLLEKKSVRGKISLYLMDIYNKKKEKQFVVPHSREEQACYLGCERSALSRELSRMKAQGLIDFQKNSFRIINLNEVEREANA